MIVLNGTFRLPVDKIENLRAAAAKMVAATLEEPGCIRYAFAQDLLDPGLIQISEAWADQAALDAHFATPHMVEWRAALAAIGTSDRNLVVYETDEGRSV